MTCKLGCGSQYRAVMFDRLGRVVCDFGDHFAGAWSRQVDRTSEASLEVAEDCCSCYPVPWMHEIGLFCEGTLVWRGPVSYVTENPDGSLSVQMLDNSVRWFQSIATKFLFTGDSLAGVDVATLFADLVAQAEALSPSGLNLTITSLTGILSKRLVFIYADLSPILTDLADEGLDWTVVGMDVYAGGTTVPAGSPLILSTEDHWDPPPSIIQDGNNQVTQVAVRFQNDALELFPVLPIPDPNFGFIRYTLHKPDIVSFPEAAALAQTYFNRHKGTQYSISTSESSLSPRFPYTIEQMIPGRVFTVATTSSCNNRVFDLRLFRMDVYIEDGHESDATIDLQPFGTGLEEA